MPRSLWMLIWLTTRARFRGIARNLKTPKGIALGIAGATLFAVWLIAIVASNQMAGKVNSGSVRGTGPWLLVLYIVMNLFTSTRDRAIFFTPAEVDFLFQAPFRPRQLLAYKIIGATLASLWAGLFMSIFLGRQTSGWVQGFAGLTLTVIFIQYFSIAATLFLNVCGEVVFKRSRTVLLGLVAVLALASAGRFAHHLSPNWAKVTDKLDPAAVSRVALLPLQPFFKTMTAPRLWPDLFLYAGLSAAINASLVALMFAIDPRHMDLEASALASARIANKLERMRRGGFGAAVGGSRTSKRRYTPPMLPWLGGSGPIAWRQLIGALRGLGRLLIFLIVISTIIASSLVASSPNPASPGASSYILPILLLNLGVFLAPSLTFDFRGDFDRIAYLKTLPVPAFQIAVGQLIAPVLVMSLLQCVGLAALALAIRDLSMTIVVAIGALLVPFNFLIFALENLLFLLMPTVRPAQPNPGDVQFMGRQTVIMICKLFLVGLAAGLAALGGFLVYSMTGSLTTAICTSWLIVSVLALALILPVATAFERFNVAADVPG